MTAPLVVYGTFGAWGIPTVSPFVLKLETWLRIAGVPYEVRQGNPFLAPKGKVPYADVDGERIADSQHIIEALQRRHPLPADAALTPAQHALGHALRRMLEEGTYFHTVRFRWIEEDGWPHQVAAFSPHLPPVIGSLILLSIRRKLRKTGLLQGSGRHDRAAAAASAAADYTAVRESLVGPFLFGEEACTYDATVAAFLWQAQGYPLDNPPRRAASDPKLLAYVAAIRERYWPELAQRRLAEASAPG